MSEQPPYTPPPAHNPYQPGQPAPWGGSPYSPYQLGPNGVPIGPPPDHPQTTTVLLLGILGFAVCQAVSPFAWVIGHRALKEIDESGGRTAGGPTSRSATSSGSSAPASSSSAWSAASPTSPW